MMKLFGATYDYKNKNIPASQSFLSKEMKDIIVIYVVVPCEF